MPNVTEVKTREQYEKLIAEAKGSIIVDFHQHDCGHCDPAALQGLAKSCDKSDTTFIRVECSEGFGSDLADALKVSGTPTTMVARDPKDLALEGEGTSLKVKGRKAIKEVDNIQDAGFLASLKCAR